MTIEQIKAYYHSIEITLYTYRPSQLDHPLLFSSTKYFLQNCGLPCDCSPQGLYFDTQQQEKLLVVNELLQTNYSELENYLVIGVNPYGDSVCIDLKRNNEVIYLNHDNDFERIYINASLQQLLECNIAYSKFIDSFRSENGEYPERHFTGEELQQLSEALTAINLKSLTDEYGWKSEIQSLLSEQGGS